MKLTKSQLKEIIREEILNEKISIRDASQAMEKRLGRRTPVKIAGFKLDIEYLSGSWRWDRGGLSIYATYGWDDRVGIPIEVRDWDDATIYETFIKIKPSGDTDKDVSNYLKAMKKVLPGLYNKYKSHGNEQS